MLWQPVEEKLTQTAADEYTSKADEGYEIAQFLRRDAVKLFSRKHIQHHVAQNKTSHIGETIPAEGQRGAGNIENDGIQVVNVGRKCRHDKQAYSTGQGRETR